MPRTIRFHLDEHCPHAIAEGLRRRGIDVTTATDAGLPRAADEDHIAFGLAEGRVIFTEDDDYLSLKARGVPHAGIAYCHQQTRSIGEIIAALVLIWEVCEPEEMTGRVEYIQAPGHGRRVAGVKPAKAGAAPWGRARQGSLRERLRVPRSGRHAIA